MLTRAALAVLLLTVSTALHGQTLVGPYNGPYTLTDLGAVPGLPTNYGGLGFLDNNTLLIGGSANNSGGVIHRVTVVRNGLGQVTGFAGPSVLYKNAPYIDGGVVFGPGGVLFDVTYSTNEMHQWKPGGGLAPDKIINLTPLGITSSTGGLNFVPAGFPGAGGIRIFSFSGSEFYTATLTPDGLGTYNLTGVTMVVSMGGGGQIDFIYVPAGAPVFNPANQYMIVNEWSQDRVSTYQLNALGYPIPATRTTFMNWIGALGICIDPVTGDWLMSNYASGSNKVIRITYAQAAQPPGGGGVRPPPGEGSHPGATGTPGGNGEGTFGFGGFGIPAASAKPALPVTWPQPRTLAEKLALLDLKQRHYSLPQPPADSAARLVGPFLELPGGARTQVSGPPRSGAALAVHNVGGPGGASTCPQSGDSESIAVVVWSLIACLGIGLGSLAWKGFGS